MVEKQFVLGIDIGGQTIKAGLYEVHGHQLNTQDDWVDTAPTEKGVADHARQVVAITKQGMQQAEQLGGRVIGVGVASPGRFGIDGLIKPKTNPNVGTYPGEFDGVHLHGEYMKAIQENAPQLLTVPFNVRNDANAMLAGMIKSIQSQHRAPIYDQKGKELTAEQLVDKMVGLIGLGTGLGHAIVHVDDTHHYHFVTDGHASKLAIQAEEQDMPLIHEAAAKLKEKSGKDEVVILPGNKVRAEDLYRSPMLNAMAGVRCGAEMDIAGNPHHLRVVQMAGKYIARTLMAIHSGENEDVNPENGWSAEDKAMAAQTSIYLFGGGLGRSALGKDIIHYVELELQQNGIDDIRMAQIPDVNVAAYAAAVMAFDALRVGTPQE